MDLSATTTTSQPRADFTALDWIAVALTIGAIAAIVAFPFTLAPMLRKMLDDFGGVQPALTELTLTRWFPLALALLPTATLAAALLGQSRLGVRRALVVAAFLLALATDAFLLIGMYLPIFELAGTQSSIVMGACARGPEGQRTRSAG